MSDMARFCPGIAAIAGALSLDSFA
jgi:hypothetical protein